MATIPRRRDGFPQYPGGNFRVSESLRNQAGEIVRDEVGVCALRPEMSATKLSRWRKGGGAPAELAVFFLALRRAGQGPRAADRILTWLEGVRDALWPEGDADELAACLAEAEADGQNAVAESRYHHDPTAPNMLALIRADEGEIDAHRARRNALLRRYHESLKGARA